MISRANRAAGFTLVEVLLAVAIAGLLMAALSGLAGQALRSRVAVEERNASLREAEFAMERMVRMVRGTHLLVVPLAENPATGWSEAMRDPGVLAVALPASVDRDQDGFADGDNDKDGLVDEDPGKDANADGGCGIKGVDDDGDGDVDETGQGINVEDDDEDWLLNEDGVDGIDTDGDGASGEDPNGDWNDDGQPGLAGVDDDGDGAVDEGIPPDDDEDGSANEDWIDTVAYYLSGSDLIERMPNLNPASGADYTESVIAENVTGFRVERVPASRAVLVDLTVEVTDPTSGEAVSLNTRVRVGGGQ